MSKSYEMKYHCINQYAIIDNWILDEYFEGLVNVEKYSLKFKCVQHYVVLLGILNL